MNRTAVFLGLAAGLSLLALVVGVPRVSVQPQPVVTQPPVPTPTPPTATVADGSIQMEGRLSHPMITPGRSDLFVTVDLTAQQVPGAQRMPVNLAVVLDRSGSMSGEKLEQAKQAARHLVRQLQPQDRLAIIHYGSDVRSLPGMQATAANRSTMLGFIDGIADDGGTNIGAGLDAGRSQLVSALNEFKVNRIILISDGQPTEGMTDDHELTGLVRQIRAQGITVSSLGVGTDFNEDLMQALAEYGSGSYGYMKDAAQLASIFQKDLMQAATTVARNVQLSFALPEGTDLGEVFGYQWSQEGRTVTVALPDFASGQVERLVARLTVSASTSGKAVDVTSLKLTYSDLIKNGQAESGIQLAAMVTERREEVLARRDKDVALWSARAQSAANMQRAATSLKKGNRAEATKLLQANQALFDQAAEVAGPQAVAGDVAEQQEYLQGMSSATSEEEVNHQVKSAKRKARFDSGRMSTTY